jgi:hypothetical protein
MWNSLLMKVWTQPTLTCIVRPNPDFSIQNCYENNRKETKVSNTDALSHTRLWGTSQSKSLENYALLFQCKLSEQKFHFTKSAIDNKNKNCQPPLLSIANPLQIPQLLFVALTILHKVHSSFLSSVGQIKDFLDILRF